MCSQPAAEMWPRNEFGNERRWSSPSPSAVASIPAPDWTVVCSIAVPSLVARNVRRRNRSIPPSPNASPSIDCIRRVASISIATFSSSGTLNGSTCIGECQVPVTGSTGARTTGSIGRRAAAFAISTASLAVRSISSGSWRAVAANPQYPFTSTRIPRPSEVERSMPSISWFRTVIDSESSATTRPSA